MIDQIKTVQLQLFDYFLITLKLRFMNDLIETSFFIINFINPIKSSFLEMIRTNSFFTLRLCFYDQSNLNCFND